MDCVAAFTLAGWGLCRASLSAGRPGRQRPPSVGAYESVLSTAARSSQQAKKKHQTCWCFLPLGEVCQPRPCQGLIVSSESLAAWWAALRFSKCGLLEGYGRTVALPRRINIRTYPCVFPLSLGRLRQSIGRLFRQSSGWANWCCRW